MNVTTLIQVMMILSLNVLVLGCGSTRPAPNLGTSGLGRQAAADADARTAELESLIRAQSEALSKLDTDKTKLEEEALDLGAQIKALNEQLVGNKTLTEQEKVEMQQTIKDLQARKTAMETQITDLNNKNVSLEQQLATTKAENDRLVKELAAAKGAQSDAMTPSTATQPSTSTGVTAAGNNVGLRAVDVNACLNVIGTGEYVQISSAACAAAQNQQFSLVAGVNTTFSIKSNLSNKCMSVLSTSEGGMVVQKTCTNTTDQSWEYFMTSSAGFRLRNRYSGKCLKVQAGKTVQGDCNQNFTIFNQL
ncbi:MAG TPA: RICIN domain-containing protein [Oligoflexus sp.]|uniref:RICIN domain-containing protein n=1 Tax=Oligoflexus sp. TaxID=1971216 RepID=UPI002D477539|nr:RICIN domain-containing protein [Oligoflexus sp.]HYX36320.1 RICIN domain-containing protein [Oligoflexus sp.]